MIFKILLQTILVQHVFSGKIQPKPDLLQIIFYDDWLEHNMAAKWTEQIFPPLDPFVK